MSPRSGDDSEFEGEKNRTSLLVNSVCRFGRFVPSNTFMLVKSKKCLRWKKWPDITKWLFVFSIVLNVIALSENLFIDAIIQDLIRIKAMMLLLS